MDSEERLFRRFARLPFHEANILASSLWKDYNKADRMKHWHDKKFMDDLLAPSGWTFLEYKLAMGVGE